MIIAIDGGACTGKSTAAKLLAERLKFCHINSGMFYRQISWLLLKSGFTIDNYKFQFDKIKLILDEYKFENDKSIETELKSQDVEEFGKQIAKIPMVREKVSKELHAIAAHSSVVIDGRNIGTTEFPNAEYKFYFVVDIHERVKRLINAKKLPATEENMLECQAKLQDRDLTDTQRSNGPLKKAEDAIEIDGTNMSPDEIVNKLYKIICN